MIIHIDSPAARVLDFVPRWIATRERARVGTDYVNYERVIFPITQHIKRFWRWC